MSVATDTPMVRQLRHGVMELYLSDHPADCAGCERGSCDLGRLAADAGVAEVRYGLGRSHADAATDVSNPYFAFDPAACIVCSRCVRACGEVQGTFASVSYTHLDVYKRQPLPCRSARTRSLRP